MICDSFTPPIYFKNDGLYYEIFTAVGDCFPSQDIHILVTYLLFE
jgi:hypothetical protein